MTPVAMTPRIRSVTVVFPANDKLQGVIAKFRAAYIMSVGSAAVISICHRWAILAVRCLLKMLKKSFCSSYLDFLQFKSLLSSC